MTDEKEDRNYEVGYGKPPAAHRFRKGQSGNPAGGRRHKRRHWTVADEELKETMLSISRKKLKLADGSKITTGEAVWRKAVKNALDGRVGAQKLVIDNIVRIEAEKSKMMMDNFERLLRHKYEMAEEYPGSARQRWPHMDHRDIEVDTVTGEANYVGPRTEEEAARFDKVAQSRDDLIEEVIELRKTPGKTAVEWLEEDLKSIARINNKLPPSYRAEPPSATNVDPDKPATEAAKQKNKSRTGKP